jgi:hypothetical protein
MLMLAAIQVMPDRMGWTVRECARYVGCSFPMITKTACWKQGARAREKKKLERASRERT